MSTLVKDARRARTLMAGTAVAAALALTVTACSSSDTEAAASAQPGASTEAAASEPAADDTVSDEAPAADDSEPVADDAVSDEAPADGGVAEVEAAIEAIELPAGPEAGSEAALAWDALMSPVGEYAAAASYAAVIDAFGEVQPYVQIKTAEERHIDALLRQLDGFGIEAPANPYLGKLPAPADLESAARAWATGEVDNVELYDDLLAQTDDRRLTRVFTNLRRASLEAHLPLFEAAADNGGSLTQEQMSDLGHGDHEPGQGGGGQGNGGGHGADEDHEPGMGGGQGKGNGQGRGQRQGA